MIPNAYTRVEKGKECVLVLWDKEWRGVRRLWESATLLKSTKPLAGGERVTMRWAGEVWLGTIVCRDDLDNTDDDESVDHDANTNNDDDILLSRSVNDLDGTDDDESVDHDASTDDDDDNIPLSQLNRQLVASKRINPTNIYSTYQKDSDHTLNDSPNPDSECESIIESNSVSDHEMSEPDSVVNNDINGDVFEIHEAREFAASVVDELRTSKGVFKKRSAKNAAEKLERNMAKHGMLPVCSCKRKCYERMTEQMRHEKHDDYWQRDYCGRIEWIRGLVDRKLVQTHRPRTSEKPPKIFTLVPHFICNIDGTEERLEVCQVMFLATLGYNTNRILRTALGPQIEIGSTTPITDKRGSHPNKNSTPETTLQTIYEHIESYHPSLPHYRREQCPNRRYLSKELSITTMHADYESKFSNIGYEVYRKCFKERNISFTALCGEECPVCDKYEHHKKETGHSLDAIGECCDICTTMAAHKVKYVRARQEYVQDRDRLKEDDEAVVSADLMKVYLIPSLPYKECIFTPRVIVFNETFAPVGDKKGVAFTWHEGTAGRKAEDIASTFVHFVKSKRECKRITIFMDNCTAQNKNWCLYTTLLRLVHQDNLAVEVLTLKYLESGHTGMSADSEHSQVEKHLKLKEAVYDIIDFNSCVETKTCRSEILQVNDFVDAEDWVSVHRLGQLGDSRPYLHDLVVAEFRRGSSSMFFKASFDDEFKLYSLLKRKVDVNDSVEQYARKTARGVQTAKKAKINAVLCPLMPAHHRVFWNKLPQCDASDDLLLNTESISRK